MNEVLKLIECWKEYKSVSVLLAVGLNLETIRNSQPLLEQMEGQKRREAVRYLQEIAKAVSESASFWRQEAVTLRHGIHQGQLRKKACLAYHKRDRFNKFRNSTRGV
jgi:hypothetical protein